MGSCCSSSDTADGAESAAPPAPSNTKTTAKPPISTYTPPRNRMADLVPADPPRPVKPSVSGISALRGNDMEASWTVVRAAGPPAARIDRHTLAPPSSQAFPTLRVVDEKSSGDSGADAFSDPELMPVAKIFYTRAEIHQAPRQHKSGDETAKQQLVGVAALTSSSDVTPERATAPTATPCEGKDRTHWPSTARVDEAPPTPKDENTMALPPDDARVLQRAPPPPPPTSSAASVTPREMSLDGEKHGVDQVHQAHQEAAVNEDEDVQEPNPLADIARSRQEKQQRYPTELSKDVAKDSPLEISICTGVSSPPRIARDVNGNSHDDVSAAPEIPIETVVVPEQADGPRSGDECEIAGHHDCSTLKETPQLHGNFSDKISRHTEPVTHEQQPKPAKDCYAEGTRLMPPAYSIQQSSWEEPMSQSEELQLEDPPLHPETSHGADVPPRAHRLLRPDTNVLWSSGHANAHEVAAKISAEVMLCGSGSEEEEEEEQGVARRLGSNAKRPITFAASSEGSHPLSMDKDRFYTMSDTDVVEKSQHTVRSAVPSVTLVAPREVTDESAASLDLRATSEMQFAENSVSVDTEAPRRMPPPLPLDNNNAARSAPLPSRPAPQSIMSPPPA